MVSFRFVVLESILDVAPTEWDEIVGEAVAIRHAVLRCYESSNIYEKKLRYFLLLDEEKKLQAAAVGLLVEKKSESGYESLILGRFANKFPIFQKLFRPVLLCGVIRGPGAPIVVRADSKHSKSLPSLLDAMEEYANQHSLSIAFSHILKEQERLLKELKSRKYYHALCIPEAIIKITWEDQRSYLEVLRRINKNYYKCAKKEINRFRKSGITIAEWGGTDEQTLYNLLKDHHLRKNKYHFELPSNFISIIKNEIYGACKIYVAHKKDEVIGVFILLKGDKTAICWKIGINHDLDMDSCTYFNLNFYYMLSIAPKFNLEKFYYGNGVLKAKKRRGCEIDFTHYFYKPKRVLWTPIIRILFSIQKIWYQRKFSYFTS